MNSAELIKALRYCISDNADDCDLCPYQSDCKSNGTGQGKMIRDAADAIERLMAEVDRKDKALQAWVNTRESREKQYRKPKKQNAALKYEQKPISKSDFDALVVNFEEEDK